MKRGPRTRKTGRKRNVVGGTLIVIGVLCLLYFCWINYSGRLFQVLYIKNYESRAERYGQEEADSFDYFTYDDLPAILTVGQSLLPSAASPVAGVEGAPADEYAPGTVQETVPAQKDIWTPIDYTQRSDYVDGDMLLVVPKMGVNSRVMNGVSYSQLKLGPGLYNESELPMNDGTVIIAAHRDIYGAWFYNIDRLGQGDQMTLKLGDKVYTYAYESTVIVEKTDWSAVKKKDYGALILTSCTPKGTSEKRIIVTAHLTDVSDREPSA